MADDLARSMIATDQAYAVAYAEGNFEDPITPDEALALLKTGNCHYRNSNRPPLEIPKTPPKVQRPIAVIICCSDSRVPPEIVFWQGIGKLFIIRNAGNILDAVAMGSLEYAIKELKMPLVVVMGHEACGAVHAAYGAWRNGPHYSGSLGAVIEPILPAVIETSLSHSKKDIPNKSINTNVARTVKRLYLDSEPIIQDRLASGTLRIVGARYNFDASVDFFDESSADFVCKPMDAAATPTS